MASCHSTNYVRRSSWNLPARPAASMMKSVTTKRPKEDITNRVVETDLLASETAVLHVSLPSALGRALKRACRRGALVEVTSRGAMSATLARDAAALASDFAVLARKGTMPTAIPSGAFIDRGQTAVMTGLLQPTIYEALMSGELSHENIDGELMVRHDDLVASMATLHGTSGRPPRESGVACALATGEGNRFETSCEGRRSLRTGLREWRAGRIPQRLRRGAAVPHP